MTKNTVPLTNYEVLQVLSARDKERPMNDITREFLEYLKKVTCEDSKTFDRNDPDSDYELKVKNANLIKLFSIK